MYLKHTHRREEGCDLVTDSCSLGSRSPLVEAKPCVSPQHKDWSYPQLRALPQGPPPKVGPLHQRPMEPQRDRGCHSSHAAVCTARAETSFPSPTRSHAGRHAQAGNAESGCQLPGTEFPSPAPWGSGNRQTLCPRPLPRKCDG